MQLTLEQINKLKEYGFITQVDSSSDILSHSIDTVELGKIWKYINNTDRTEIIEEWLNDGPTPTNNYLTFEAIEDNIDIIFGYPTQGGSPLTIEVSTDGETWIEKQSVEGGGIISTISAGEKLYVRGNNPAYGYYDDDEDSVVGHYFAAAGDCYVYGNVMSLVGWGTTVNDYAFSYLFSDYMQNYDGSWLYTKDDSPIILPATTLADYCYNNMFSSCKSLTTVPSLPATTLADFCYNGMFFNCTSLTIAPSLPATTLADSCYNGMFFNCTSLTTAPELPATTLVENCYNSMFSSCKSLTIAPSLPATTLADSCYNGMFFNCTSLATVPSLPATTLADYCYFNMFHNCTSLTTVPTLPATILTEHCYRYMFSGCTNLNYIKCLATDISASYCTSSWVDGVAVNGTFVKDPNMSSWTTGANGIPSGWDVEDAT